jgi:hypothetical protein
MLEKQSEDLEVERPAFHRYKESTGLGDSGEFEGRDVYEPILGFKEVQTPPSEMPQCRVEKPPHQAQAKVIRPAQDKPGRTNLSD